MDSPPCFWSTLNPVDTVSPYQILITFRAIEKDGLFNGSIGFKAHLFLIAKGHL